MIADRYTIVDYLGSGVFSRAVQCSENESGRMVCIKIIRNNKDFLDQSLGEIKLLRYLNENDPNDEKHVLQMLDFFYHREHLFIVCELLRDNLYELYRYISKSKWATYFTLDRVQSIAHQALTALEYMHSLNLRARPAPTSAPISARPLTMPRRGARARPPPRPPPPPALLPRAQSTATSSRRTFCSSRSRAARSS